MWPHLPGLLLKNDVEQDALIMTGSGGGVDSRWQDSDKGRNKEELCLCVLFFLSFPYSFIS